ncbi:hypothetical protein, partial [Bathymodiolus platifrons methanotrophic gill symbiont]|uniref:hypothetical protein n=1 Tax=Bathymodiolus platifrons methanotrophic gill symbiont TaxID=113268 RepID=UPI001C8E5DF7
TLQTMCLMGVLAHTCSSRLGFFSYLFILTNYHCLLLMRGARFKRNHLAVIDSDCGECVG